MAETGVAKNWLGFEIPAGSHWNKPVGRGVQVEHHDDGTVLAWCVTDLYPEGAAQRKVARVLQGVGEYWLPSKRLAEGTLRVEGPFVVARTVALDG